MVGGITSTDLALAAEGNSGWAAGVRSSWAWRQVLEREGMFKCEPSLHFDDWASCDPMLGTAPDSAKAASGSSGRFALPPKPAGSVIRPGMADMVFAKSEAGQDQTPGVF
jgi:hypothetical protein